jgi:predicted CopG family antitoxin
MEPSKESKTIRISKENYDKIVSLGDMTRTFDSVLSDIMEKANLLGASATSNKETITEEN